MAATTRFKPLARWRWFPCLPRQVARGRVELWQFLIGQNAPLWKVFPASEVAHGVFRDTRTPVSVVFDNLEVGASISEIMEWFHLTHEQVVAVIEFAARIHYVRRQSKGRHENDTRPS